MSSGELGHALLSILTHPLFKCTLKDADGDLGHNQVVLVIGGKEEGIKEVDDINSCSQIL